MKALCRDRFWDVYASEIYDEARVVFEARGNQTFARRDFQHSISKSFAFCNPYNSREHLHCNLDLQFTARPDLLVPARSKLTLVTLSSIQKRFPYFAHSLATSSQLLPYSEFSLKITRITLKYIACPKTSHYIASGLDLDGDHHSMVADGPLCKQFSRKMSKCVPEVRLLTSSGAASIPSDLRPASQLGFCLGMPGAGQFCVSGSPEIGIQCPQGKVIRCARPSNSDPASWTDIGDQALRCSQNFGLIPTISPSSPPSSKSDPFRVSPIANEAGQILSFGWWAQCRKLSAPAVPPAILT